MDTDRTHGPDAPEPAALPLEPSSETAAELTPTTSRRSFLAGAGAGAAGAGLVLGVPAAAARRERRHDRDRRGGLTEGDAAILRFLAAAEIIETDAWQQYNELGGVQDSEVPGGTGNTDYTEALSQLDQDMAQYVHDNTDDEISHFTFINAYLMAHGDRGVNLDRFRTLPSSKATGAQQIGRLTNLMQLTVDTSWFTRYRSDSGNPDLGDTFPQAIPGLAAGQFPAIPRDNGDSARPTTCRRSRTPPAFTSRSSSRAGRASTRRSRSG